MFWTVKYIDNLENIFFMFFLKKCNTHENDFILKELLPN